MNITYKGDYALKAVLELSMEYGKILTIGELAKRLDIPVKFLEQVLLLLKRGGFVSSLRGKVGGYILAKVPSKINVGEVISFIDGPIEPIGCVKKGYSECKDVSSCVLREVFQDVNRATMKIVENVSFAQLSDKVRASKQSYVYSI